MTTQEFITLAEGKEVQVVEDKELTEGTGYHKVILTDEAGAISYNVDTATVLELTKSRREQ